MSRVAILMLAHANLARAGAVAGGLARQEAVVAAHVDARADRSAFDAHAGPGVLKVPSVAAPWGGMGLVEATLAGLAALRASGAPFSHVALISGADLPLRPVSDLEAFLSDHPDRDFIETAPPARWVRGGLAEERATLWHPFNWRRHRRLFDLSVSLQRKFGARRAPPLPLRLGAQWWCLSRRTVDLVLDAPELAAWRRWWRWSWIPDESFFQTITHALAPDRRAGDGLTWSAFDRAGRPRVLYDDHLAAVGASDYFFARKIDPGAEALYAIAQDPPAQGAGLARRPPALALPPLRLRDQSPALANPGTWPPRHYPGWPATPAPYKVLAGFDQPIPELRTWLGPQMLAELHGRIFAETGDVFADGEAVGPGGAVSVTAVNAIEPRQTLANLIAAGAPRVQAFLWDAEDLPGLGAVLIGDSQARIAALADAWAFGPELDLPTARRRMAAERRFLRESRAHVTDPGRLLADPLAAISEAMEAIGEPAPSSPPILSADDIAAKFRRYRAMGLDVSRRVADG